ncbi:MAG: PEP-CTERM sorting domain-containing protein [Phycisphaerae bacterium]
MFRKIGLSAVVWAMLAFDAPAARAGLITFSFGGDLDSTTVDDSANLLGGATSFTGSYTFDMTVADGVPGDSTVGDYDAVTSLTFNIDTVTFESVGVPTIQAISVTNDAFDSYEVSIEATNSSGDLLSIAVRLKDTDATIFSTDALPPSPPSLMMVEENRFDLIDFSVGPNFAMAIGSLASLVPEPASSVLFAVCVLGLVRSRRRRGGSSRRLHRR